MTTAVRAPLRTIELSGQLGKLFGKRHKIHVRDTAEAVRALCANFPEFRQHLVSAESRGVAYTIYHGKRNIDPHEELGNPVGNHVIRIMPVPIGARKGFFQIILGAALIGASFLIAPGASAAMLQVKMAAFGIGTGMVLGGISQMLSPKPRFDVPDDSKGADNKTFSGAVQLTAQGGVVPIAIGKVLVGSTVISGSILTTDGTEVTLGTDTDTGASLVGLAGGPGGA